MEACGPSCRASSLSKFTCCTYGSENPPSFYWIENDRALSESIGRTATARGVGLRCISCSFYRQRIWNLDLTVTLATYSPPRSLLELGNNTTNHVSSVIPRESGNQPACYTSAINAWEITDSDRLISTHTLTLAVNSHPSPESDRCILNRNSPSTSISACRPSGHGRWDQSAS